MSDADLMNGENLTVGTVVRASLHRSKAAIVRNRYIMSKGALPSQIRWLTLIESQSNLIDEDIIRKYVKEMSLERFLSKFEQQSYGMQCLSKLMMKYLQLQPVLSDQVRLKLWKSMTKTDKSMKLSPSYYSSLKSSYTTSFNEFSAIIGLDVRRTPAAVDNPTIYANLTNVLTAYSK